MYCIICDVTISLIVLYNDLVISFNVYELWAHTAESEIKL